MKVKYVSEQGVNSEVAGGKWFGSIYMYRYISQVEPTIF